MFKTQKKEQAVNLKDKKGFAPFSRSKKPSHVEIANKAYELYEKKGHKKSQDWDNWFQAEELCCKNKL